MEYILQLEGGVNLVNLHDDKGCTPLIQLATTYDHSHLLRRKMAELLLQHSADIYVRDNNGDMAAHHFAWRGRVGCLQPIIEAGFHLLSRGQYGGTILHRAVVGGETMIEYLLGLDGGKMIIDIENDDGKTPLQLASEMGNVGPVMKLLMRHGATCSSR